MDFSTFGNLVISGLAVGAVYAIVGMSFNIVFATTNILNFSTPGLLMVGAMFGVFLYGSLGYPVVFALVLTVGMGIALGVGVETLAVRPLRGREDNLVAVLSTFGFGLVLQALFTIFMGTRPRPFPAIVPLRPFATVGGIRLGAHHMLLIGAALVVAALMHIYLRRTLTGKALRAVALDWDAAALRGIPVRRLSILSFAIAGGLAALAGFLAGPLTSAFPSMGLELALKGFIAAAIGGMGISSGALIGGLLLGVIESVAQYSVGTSYTTATALVLLLAILMVRPNGILGRRQLREV